MSVPKVPQEVPLVDRSTEGGTSHSHPDRCSYSKTVELMAAKVALGIPESCIEKLSSLHCFLPTNGAACRLNHTHGKRRAVT